MVRKHNERDQARALCGVRALPCRLIAPAFLSLFPPRAHTEGAVYYSYQGTEALDGDVPQKSRSAIVNDFKAFIRNHFAHDKRATDDPLLYRCVLVCLCSAVRTHVSLNSRSLRLL